MNGSSGFEIVKCLLSTHTHRLNNENESSHAALHSIDAFSLAFAHSQRLSSIPLAFTTVRAYIYYTFRTLISSGLRRLLKGQIGSVPSTAGEPAIIPVYFLTATNVVQLRYRASHCQLVEGSWPNELPLPNGLVTAHQAKRSTHSSRRCFLSLPQIFSKDVLSQLQENARRWFAL